MDKDNTGFYLCRQTLLIVRADILEEIRCNGISKEWEAMLYHQLGTVQGLLGHENQQKAAWQNALDLCPDNETIRQSLASLV